MKECIREILTGSGQQVTLKSAEGDKVMQAFLQPLTGRGEQVPGQMCGIGALDERLWLYLGQTEVQPGDRILREHQMFRVRSSRIYHIGETPLYWWATLEMEREAAE